MGNPDLRGIRPTPTRPVRVGVGLLLGIILALLPGSTAAAGETKTFGTTPHPAKVDGEARSSFTVPEQMTDPAQDTLRVYNRTDQPLTLQVYSAPVELGDDGVYAVGFSHQRTGLAERIRPETGSIDLAPRADALVRFTVHPGETTDGLAALVLEPVDPQATGTVDLVERVAILVKTTSSDPGNLVGPPPADEGLPMVPLIAIAIAAVAGLLAWGRVRRSRSGSDETADQVPDEDRAREVHQRVHRSPAAP